MRLCSLVTSILLVALSNGISARPATISANDVNQLAEFHCVDRKILQITRNGSPQNCAKALITSFPNSIAMGQFHHGGPNDAFRLPRAYVFGDCQVTVDLNGVETVEGSWQQIWTLANALSVACTYYRISADPQTAVTGGYIHAGQGNGIAIILSKPTRVMGNDSSLADE